MFLRDLHNLQNTMDQMFDSMMQRYDQMDDLDSSMMLMGSDQPMDRSMDKDNSAMTERSDRRHRSGHLIRRGDNEMMHDRAGRHDMMKGMMGGGLMSGMSGMMDKPVMNMKMSPIDLKESPNEYTLSCELAGCDRKSIDIAADKDKHMVTIRAEKREEHSESNMPSKTADKSTTETTETTTTSSTEGQAAAGTVSTQGDRTVGMPSGHRFIRQERSYGMVERSLRIPEDADFDHSEASFTDGVLKLRIPRMAKKDDSFTQKIRLS